MKRLLAVCALLLASCASPNRYGTARTLAPGESSTWASLDLLGGAEYDGSAIPIPVPRIGARRGLTEDLEIGATYTGLFAVAGDVGLDLKWRFLDAAGVQMAVAPTVNGVLVSTQEDGERVGVFQAGLPLLADIDVAPWLTLVPQVGGGWIWVHGASPNPGFVATWGLGVQVRPSAHFAFQPGVYATHALGQPDEPLLVGGLALIFGAQPPR